MIRDLTGLFEFVEPGPPQYILLYMPRVLRFNTLDSPLSILEPVYLIESIPVVSRILNILIFYYVLTMRRNPSTYLAPDS